MSYMSGEHYIWRDDSSVHFWSANGYDSWDTTVWAVDAEGKRLVDRGDASGTSVPADVVDEFVVMRLAQMLEGGTLKAAIERATAADYAGGGNVGQDALLRKARALMNVVRSLDCAKPARRPRKDANVVEMATDAPHALADTAAREHRLGLLKTTAMQPLFDFVEAIRVARGLEREIPWFDPCDGGVEARVLFLLEAPGPKAVATGFVSQNNPDPTAKNFCELTCHAGLNRQDIVIWNIAPWYLGTGDKIVPATADDIADGLGYLTRLLGLLPKLEVIVLVGRKAQTAEAEIRKMTELPIHRTHHMSARVFNVWPERRAETQAAFRAITELLRGETIPPRTIPAVNDGTI